MGARQKLNTAHIFGCILVAAMIGISFGSVPVFVIGLAVLVAGAINAGDIRTRPWR